MHTALDCKKILTTDGYLINKTEHQRKSLKAEISVCNGLEKLLLN